MAGAFNAQFFDGHSAATHNVSVGFSASGLQITFPHAPDAARNWAFSGLTAIEKPRDGEPLRLSHTSEKAARLIVPVGQGRSYILSRAEHLHGVPVHLRLLRYGGLAAASLAVIFLLGYGLLNFAPQVVAGWLPQEWRDQLADQTEQKFIGDTKQCSSGAGKAALARLASRVAGSLEESPEFSLRVIDLPFINAFALPGGRVVLTGKLIEKAETPAEVAGVLAHELGHVAHLHPEAQFVRILGLQLVISLVTGGSSGDMLGSVAGLVALLQYTRAAEYEADDYARELMRRGEIDPAGLRRFFEKLSESETSLFDGKLKQLSNMLSTHPGSKERMETFEPLPAGQAREVLSDAEWRALKKICAEKN